MAHRDNPRLQLSRPSDAQHGVRPRLRLVHILQTWHPAPQVHDAAAHKDVDRQTRGCRVFAQLAIAGGRLSAIARIRSSSMMPGPLGIAETSPTALAPYAIARRASSTLLVQQTLIRIPPHITAKCKCVAGVWCDRLIATELCWIGSVVALADECAGRRPSSLAPHHGIEDRQKLHKLPESAITSQIFPTRGTLQ